MTHSTATRLGETFTDVRKSGLLWWPRPDGKTQVTIQYSYKADSFVEPLEEPHRGDLHTARRALEGHEVQGGGWLRGRMPPPRAWMR